MSFAAAVVLAAGVLIGMFALLFGLAYVEQRMFDDVMVDPVTDAADEPAGLDADSVRPPSGDELRRAA